jgi:hypothetical protein
MKRIYIARLFLIFGLFCCYQCKTIRIKDLQPKGELSTKLPRLTPIFNVYPIPLQPQAYYGYVDSAIRQPILLPPQLDSSEQRGIRNSYYQDRNASELEVYFARDVERNMTQNQGKNNGFISCTITAFEQPPLYNGGLMYLHLIGLGIPTLLGIPFTSAMTEIEVQVNIKNLKNEIIGTYIGYGKNRKTSGAYYGYRPSQIQRITIIKAFEAAMRDVKAQISADTNNLIEKL